MAKFIVTANVVHSTRDGHWTRTRQLPTFLVDPTIQGCEDTVDGAEFVARELLLAAQPDDTGAGVEVHVCACPAISEPPTLYTVTWETATGSVDGDTGDVVSVHYTEQGARDAAIAEALDWARGGRFCPESILVDGEPVCIPFVADHPDDGDPTDDWEIWINVVPQVVRP